MHRAACRHEGRQVRLLFRTDAVAPDDRVDYWRDAMKETLAADCLVEPARSLAFGVSMGVLACGPVDVIEIAGAAYTSTRRGEGRAGRVSVKFQLEGCGAVRAGPREACLAPGDACIVPPDRAFVAERTTPFRQVLLDVDAEALERVLPSWSALVAQRLAADAPGVRAAGELARYIVNRHADLDAGCRQQLGDVALRLLGGIAGDATPPPAARNQPPSRVAAYHRRRIERYVDDHLGDADLSVPGIAAALGLSTRYIHKLFAAGGTPVMQWVLTRRLQACRCQLAARGSRPVSDVAYEWGFTSASHFSRAFRKHFGLRPSDV